MNDGRNLTKQRAQALAAYLHLLRPDWDEPGTVHALGMARDRGDAYLISVAAIRCAGDPSNRTPAIIALDGQHWRPRSDDDEAEPTYTPAAVDDMRCAHCGRWIVRAEPHQCGKLGDAHAGAAQARAALTAARTAKESDDE